MVQELEARTAGLKPTKIRHVDRVIVFLGLFLTLSSLIVSSRNEILARIYRSVLLSVMLQRC